MSDPQPRLEATVTTSGANTLFCFLCRSRVKWLRLGWWGSERALYCEACLRYAESQGEY